jgi:hypothetical protein
MRTDIFLQLHFFQVRLPRDIYTKNHQDKQLSTLEYSVNWMVYLGLICPAPGRKPQCALPQECNGLVVG